ncbi:hypothetical protein E2562_011155 [Oryza meyeriana var. granulata]|uniref:Protein BZR1 homolog n=1 Tax=Oryza meyeriana var. granulata TaxID=110450 RepID=A0A6G1DFC8_9ORYZ|nr:hypothetical protein E2562_011155 [Oryza meyeriana var. granulata]
MKARYKPKRAVSSPLLHLGRSSVPHTHGGRGERASHISMTARLARATQTLATDPVPVTPTRARSRPMQQSIEEDAVKEEEEAEDDYYLEAEEEPHQQQQLAAAVGRRGRAREEKERTKLRERQRRAITARILAGLRRHGNYNLRVRADINEVIAALAREAGWVVLPDGTTFPSSSSSSSSQHQQQLQMQV